MEKDGFFSWQSDSHGTAAAEAAAAAAAEMNNNDRTDDNKCMDESQSAAWSSMKMAASCFPNLNWDQSSTDQTSNFESALSSLVSSPTSSHPNLNHPNLHYSSASAADSIVIRELIGRLGSICSNNSSPCTGKGIGGVGGVEISPSTTNPQPCYHSTNASSCYSTPLNSPPTLNLAMFQDHHIHPPFQFPPHHHPIPFAADPGFAERAARFSCFGAAGNGNGGNNVQFGKPDLHEPGKLSRVSSSQSLKAMPTEASPGTADIGIGGQLVNHDMMALMMRSSSSCGEFVDNNNAQQQDSSGGGGAYSDPIAPGGSEGNAIRKRRAAVASSNSNNGSKTSSCSSRRGGGGGMDAAPANPSKVADDENFTSKRCKSVADPFANGADDDTAVVTTARTPKVRGSGQGTTKQWKDNDKDNAKPPEPPKQDYIHVRARRGQATDSHSLAERVRREKISERMKFLQDLVPACNKVTGKAVMLDEIINYVQSLQRQVEFLSMKLATVNPRLDFNADSLLSKDMHQPPCGPMMPPQSPYQLEASCTTTGLSYGNQLPQGQGHPHLQSLMGGNGPLDNNTLLDATSLRRSLSMQLHPLDGFTDTAASSRSQLGAFWGDDLQSVVQMGLIGQTPEAISPLTASKDRCPQTT